MKKTKQTDKAWLSEHLDIILPDSTTEKEKDNFKDKLIEKAEKELNE